jgi:hypothetical protein
MRICAFSFEGPGALMVPCAVPGTSSTIKRQMKRGIGIVHHDFMMTFSGNFLKHRLHQSKPGGFAKKIFFRLCSDIKAFFFVINESNQTIRCINRLK